MRSGRAFALHGVEKQNPKRGRVQVVFLAEPLFFVLRDVAEAGLDGSIVFSAEVAGTGEVKHWVLSCGRSAEVLEPQSLRKEGSPGA